MFNYLCRYMLTILELNYREAYWDQVKLNETWFNLFYSNLDKNE